MPETRTLILADDLTGANDTAIQFRKYGFSALVVTDIVRVDTALLNDYDVIAINSDSRRMCPDDAYRAVYDTVKAFEIANGSGFGVYKKVDSVLRGNPGRELAAMMDALDIPLALIAPAFPANRSVLEHGRLPSGADAVRIFADGSGRKTANIPLATIRQGALSIVAFMHTRNSRGTQVLVADAVNDTDLEAIYAASTSLKKTHILTGSAGLANQLARNLGKEKDSIEEKPVVLSPIPALVVAGSRQGETAAQICALSQSLSLPIIRFKVSLVKQGKCDEAVREAQTEATELMRRNIPVCIIAVESMFQPETVNKHNAEKDEMDKAISEALGVLTGRLFDEFYFSLLVSTGGDTSMGICRHLGISGMEPLQEICPGIPLTRIVGGVYNGRFMITKSGRFGDQNTLLKILHRTD